MIANFDQLDGHNDVIVVGAGASGAALGWTLGTHSKLRTLVVESGELCEDFPQNHLPHVDVPHPAQRWIDAQLTPEQTRQVPRGVGPGGSMRINGGYYLWGDPQEIASWDDSNFWNTGDVLSSFQIISTRHDSPKQGKDDGLINVMGVPVSEIGQRFVDACVAYGLAYQADKNSGWGPSVGPLVTNIGTFGRSTPADALLGLASRRSSLKLLTGADVMQIMFVDNKVSGVVIVNQRDGREQHVSADRVVLCCGAVGTPELLIRSGVGPRDVLDELGVQQVLACDSLGQRAWEHPVVELPVIYRGGSPDELNNMMADRFFGVASHLDIDGHVVELMPLLRPYHSPVTNPLVLPIRCTLMTPRSVSRLRFYPHQVEGISRAALRTVVDFGHLQHENDRQVLQKALRIAVSLVDEINAQSTGTWSANVEASALEDVMGNKWETWLFNNIDTAHHLMGTAPMGSIENPVAVVNPMGIVHGLHGLWVGDTSIIPQPLSRGTAATAVMIGHRIGLSLIDQEC